MKHTEVRKGTIININGEPYEVLEHSHSVKARGSSVMQTRIRNLKTGNVIQRSFHPKDDIEEADIDKEEAIFIYARRGSCIFAKKEDRGKRFTLSEECVGDKLDYLKENTPVTIILFNEEPISVSIPVKVELKVTEAPPGVKGDRSQGGTKTVTLETGKKMEVPLFVEREEIIEVNTETGEYVRRMQK